MDALGSRCSFSSILGCLWESPGFTVDVFLVICLRLGVPKWETVSRSMFLMIQRWKCYLHPVAVCAINIVKTMVFE